LVACTGHFSPAADGSPALKYHDPRRGERRPWRRTPSSPLCSRPGTLTGGTRTGGP